MKWVSLRVLAVAAATLATLAGLEVLLRILPAYGGARRTPVDDRRRRFEFPRDDHWNALGHAVCFDAVRSSALLTGTFPSPGPAGAQDPRRSPERP